MLAAFLEHPLLEVAHRSTEESRECDRPPKCSQVCHCWVNVKNYQLNPLERKKQCTVVALEKTQQLQLHVWTFGYYVYSKYFSLLNIRGISESPKLFESEQNELIST